MTVLRRALALLLIGLLVGSPTGAVAAGNCGVFRTWSTGDSLTASDLNSSFTQAATTNSTYQCLDDYSATQVQMEATTDPNSSGTASLATTGAGELERLRYVLQHQVGRSVWWKHYEDINFGHRGVRNHLTALTAFKEMIRSEASWPTASVRYHGLALSVIHGGHPESALALFHVNGTTAFYLSPTGDVHLGGSLAVAPGTVQYPSYTAVTDHQTGVYFPAQNAVGVTVGRTEIARVHGYGLLMAPHATVGFRGLTTANGHITALSLGSGMTVQVGDAEKNLVLRGGNFSLTANSTFGVNAAGTAVETKAISGTGITISHTAGALTFSVPGNVNAPGSRGQFSYTGGTANGGDVFTLTAHSVVLMNASTHALAIQQNPSAINVNITTSGPTANGRDSGTALAASSWVHFYWIWNGTTLAGVASPQTPAAGPNLPSGYTHWSYAGAVYLNDNSVLRGTHIMGSLAVFHTAHIVMSLGKDSTETAVSLSAAAPPNATRFRLLVENTGTAQSLAVRVISGINYWSRPASLAVYSEFELPMISQRFYYIWGGVPGTGVNLYVGAYVLPNGGG